MSFNKEQFEDLIRETLDEHGLGGDAAVNLLLGTAAVESAFGTYLKQIRGPALGVFQMEPATFRWLCDKYGSKMYSESHDANSLSDLEFDEYLLVTNLDFAILMARLRYLADPEPLPAADDPMLIMRLAEYWKRVYNTHLGAGTVDDFCAAWDTFVG